MSWRIAAAPAPALSRDRSSYDRLESGTQTMPQSLKPLQQAHNPSPLEAVEEVMAAYGLLRDVYPNPCLLMPDGLQEFAASEGSAQAAALKTVAVLVVARDCERAGLRRRVLS